MTMYFQEEVCGGGGGGRAEQWVEQCNNNNHLRKSQDSQQEEVKNTRLDFLEEIFPDNELQLPINNRVDICVCRLCQDTENIVVPTMVCNKPPYPPPTLSTQLQHFHE